MIWSTATSCRGARKTSPPERNCAQCGYTIWEAQRSTKKYCSAKCRRAATRKPYQGMQLAEITCECCQQVFRPHMRKQRFCSSGCHDTALRDWIGEFYGKHLSKSAPLTSSPQVDKI